MRALVVDDSRAIRRIIKKILLEIGFDVLEAANGVEGLQRLGESQKIDIVLLDWNMPEMNGYEFICKVRSNPLFYGVPVMMVSSETEMTQMEKALKAGANEYVMKPFTKEILTSKLMQLGIVS